MIPLRKNWSGVLPVPGNSGEYEWAGFRRAAELPHSYNPATHFIATANHNILPPGYSTPLGYEWALPFRFRRIEEMLATKKKLTIEDFERMQQDVVSLPARRLQAIIRKWTAEPASREAKAIDLLLRWDGNLSTDSAAALIFEYWMGQLPRAVFGPEIGPDVDLAFLEHALQHAGDVVVLDRQDVVEHFDQDHFGADGVVEVRELAADSPAAAKFKLLGDNAHWVITHVNEMPTPTPPEFYKAAKGRQSLKLTVIDPTETNGRPREVTLP